MQNPIDKLVADADALLEFLQQYPPHFADGKSMHTDVSGYVEALRESADGLRERRLLTLDDVITGEFLFRNYYECPNDGESWEDQHSCACNDRCPKCNAEIEPYKSDVLDPESGDLIEAGVDCRVGSS